MAGVKKIQKYLESHHPGEFKILKTEDGKPKAVHCRITEHDIPLDLDQIKAHWGGKAYRRALRKKQSDTFDKEEELPEHFEFHKWNPGKIFCTLTRRSLNNSKAEVAAHMKGRKFQNSLDDMQQLKALEIPSDLDFDSDDVALLVEDPEFRKELEEEFEIDFRDVPPEEIQSHLDAQAEIDAEAAQFSDLEAEQEDGGDEGDDDMSDAEAEEKQTAAEDSDVEMGGESDDEQKISRRNMQQQQQQKGKKTKKGGTRKKKSRGEASQASEDAGAVGKKRSATAAARKASTRPKKKRQKR